MLFFELATAFAVAFFLPFAPPTRNVINGT